MIHWCSLKFTTFNTAQKSTWVQRVALFLLEVPDIICIAGNPLLKSNGISTGWIMTEHLNIPAEITNNGDFFELSSLSSSPLFVFHADVLSIL